MKKIKLFSRFLLIIFTIVSCSSEDSSIEETVTNIEETVTNSVDLINIHSQIKQKFDSFSLTSKAQKNVYSKGEQNELKEYIDKVYNANYEFAMTNGVESLFSEYGLNPDLINVAEWAIGFFATKSWTTYNLLMLRIQTSKKDD